MKISLCGFVVLGFWGISLAASMGVEERRADGRIAGEQSPVMLITGSDSAVKTAKCERIRTAEGWEAAWHEHQGQTADEAFRTLARRVEIDFARYEVIAIFQGGGINSRGINVKNIHETDDGVTLKFDEWHYQSGIGPANQATAFGFVVIPKTDKAVTVEENVQGLKGGPEKWKSLAKLVAED